MAGWTTIDDFETGSYGGGWSGDTDVITVAANSGLEGDYCLVTDTDAANYASNEEFKVFNSQTVQRNSSGNKTIRFLCDYDHKDTYSGTSLLFSVEDSLNYYKLKIAGQDDDPPINRTFLYKVVDGEETELASYNHDIYIKGVEIKCETELITVYVYTSTDFTNANENTVTSSDVTFDSGYVGISHKTNLSADQGVKKPYSDYIQYYDSGAAPPVTNPKLKQAGTFATATIKTKISGTFVEKPQMVKVGGTFQ